MQFFICLAYIAVEIYLIVSVVELSGFWIFVLEVAISALLGLGILASQLGTMSDSISRILTLNLGINTFLVQSVLRFLSGFLLILPFVLSDILGIVFFVMSLFFKPKEKNLHDWRREFERDFMREMQGLGESSDSNTSEIIDAEIIESEKQVAQNSLYEKKKFAYISKIRAQIAQIIARFA